MNFGKMFQKWGKSNWKIWYFHWKIWYFHFHSWAQELMRKEISPTKAQYGLSELVLAFIRDIGPGDIVGEIREITYKVNLLVFCEKLGIRKI